MSASASSGPARSAWRRSPPTPLAARSIALRRGGTAGYGLSGPYEQVSTCGRSPLTCSPGGSACVSASWITPCLSTVGTRWPATSSRQRQVSRPGSWSATTAAINPYRTWIASSMTSGSSIWAPKKNARCCWNMTSPAHSSVRVLPPGPISLRAGDYGRSHMSTQSISMSTWSRPGSSRRSHDPQTPSAPPRAARGAELKRLRELNGVSGRMVAKALGISQSAVSRKEAGGAPLSLPEVTAWADAIRASQEDRGRLLWMAEQAVTETIPLESWHAETGAAGIQHEIGMLERASRFIANFQPDFVPGLLQTAEYARRVLAAAGNPDPATAALRRLDRQAILHDLSHRLEFIITEAALRWRTGPPDILVPQLDRIASLATLGNLTVEVIPLDAEWRTAPPYPFVLYEDRDDGAPPMAVAELPDQRIETANIEPY